MELSFLTESTRDFQETQTVGGFRSGERKNTFDSLYESVASAFDEKNVDVKRDIATLVNNPTIMATYKENLLSLLKEDANRSEDEGHAARCYEAVDAMWDNCVSDFIKESQSVSSLLPIKTVDLPILVKQHIKAAAKDIMQTEIAKSPLIKKHIERTYVVDAKSGREWEYPRCFFDGTYSEFFEAGSGLPIKLKDPITLPAYQFDIIDELGAMKGHDKLSYDIRITMLYDASNNKYPVDLRFNLSDGRLMNNQIELKAPDGTAISDLLTGAVDFETGLISLSSCSGKIKKVDLGGFLSNENNERAVSLQYRREEKQFTIKDGFRMVVPYSMEQLEDAKALLNIDLYKKTYDNIADIQTELEDSNILKFLDDEFEKYNGVEVDVLGFNSFVRNDEFDCDHSSYSTVALRSEYIEKELKFKIDRTIIDMCDTAKIEDMTFVIYGNPRYISLLGKNVNWVVRSGDSLGGVRLNYSYGVMTSGDIKVQIVSALKIPEKKKDGTPNNAIRIIPFPLDPEMMTFKHYKWTTHIFTTANSGYKAADLPGGSYTAITATNRCTTESIQGIQTNLEFKNSGFVSSNAKKPTGTTTGGSAGSGTSGGTTPGGGTGSTG